jgi:hypothetical protein
MFQPQIEMPAVTDVISPNQFYGKRVVCIDFYNCTPHLETSLEIGLRIAEVGGSFYHFFAGECLAINEGYNSARARYRQSLKHVTYDFVVRKAAAKYARLKKLSFHSEELPPPIHFTLPDSVKMSLAEAKNISELKLVKHNHLAVGQAVANSLVWLTKDSLIDPRSQPILVDELSASYVQAYGLSMAVMQKNNYDLALIFNGRFCPYSAVKDAASVLRISPLFHERGSDETRFSLRSSIPHDMYSIQQEIREYWNSSSLVLDNIDQKRCVANTFFARKRSGDGIAWESFTTLQKSGLAANLFKRIRCIKPGTPIVAYFHSCEDEMIALEERYFPAGPFGYQVDALHSFYIHACHEKAHLIVRLHPHLAAKSGNDLEMWMNLCNKFGSADVTIVSPESPISTYEIIDMCDVVAVYASTVGVEAVASGKPVIALGPCLYDNIGVDLVKPKSLADLDTAIADALQKKVDRKSADIYGYWSMVFGSPYKYFKPSGLHGGTFLGVTLIKPKGLLLKILESVRKLKSRLS